MIGRKRADNREKPVKSPARSWVYVSTVLVTEQQGRPDQLFSIHVFKESRNEYSLLPRSFWNRVSLTLRVINLTSWRMWNMSRKVICTSRRQNSGLNPSWSGFLSPYLYRRARRGEDYVHPVCSSILVHHRI